MVLFNVNIYHTYTYVCVYGMASEIQTQKNTV